VNRETAARELHALCVGLSPDPAGVSRLLERIAASDVAEELRGALVEGGALALIGATRGGEHADH
jgi:hypothetical protein